MRVLAERRTWVELDAHLYDLTSRDAEIVPLEIDAGDARLLRPRHVRRQAASDDQPHYGHEVHRAHEDLFPPRSEPVTGRLGRKMGQANELGANQERPEALLYLTSRSHTARAAWRLRREAPGTRTLVRAPRTDDFHVDSWWHRRGSTREVMTEYLRSFNSYVLGDAWRERRASGAGDRPRADQASQRP